MNNYALIQDDHFDVRFGKIKVFWNPSDKTDMLFSKSKNTSSKKEFNHLLKLSQNRFNLNHDFLLTHKRIEEHLPTLSITDYYFYPNSDLNARLTSFNDPLEICQFLNDLLQATSYLEKNEMIHGNLRPELIYYDSVREKYILIDNFFDGEDPVDMQLDYVRNNDFLFISEDVFEALIDSKTRTQVIFNFQGETFAIGLLVIFMLVNSDSYKQLFDIEKGVFSTTHFWRIKEFLMAHFFSNPKVEFLGFFLFDVLLNFDSLTRASPIQALKAFKSLFLKSEFAPIHFDNKQSIDGNSNSLKRSNLIENQSSLQNLNLLTPLHDFQPDFVFDFSNFGSLKNIMSASDYRKEVIDRKEVTDAEELSYCGSERRITKNSQGWYYDLPSDTLIKNPDKNDLLISQNIQSQQIPEKQISQNFKVILNAERKSESSNDENFNSEQVFVESSRNVSLRDLQLPDNANNNPAIIYQDNTNLLSDLNNNNPDVKDPKIFDDQFKDKIKLENKHDDQFNKNIKHENKPKDQFNHENQPVLNLQNEEHLNEEMQLSSEIIQDNRTDILQTETGKIADVLAPFSQKNSTFEASNFTFENNSNFQKNDLISVVQIPSKDHSNNFSGQQNPKIELPNFSNSKSENLKFSMACQTSTQEISLYPNINSQNSIQSKKSQRDLLNSQTVSNKPKVINRGQSPVFIYNQKSSHKEPLSNDLNNLNKNQPQPQKNPIQNIQIIQQQNSPDFKKTKIEKINLKESDFSVNQDILLSNKTDIYQNDAHYNLINSNHRPSHESVYLDTFLPFNEPKDSCNILSNTSKNQFTKKDVPKIIFEQQNTVLPSQLSQNQNPQIFDKIKLSQKYTEINISNNVKSALKTAQNEDKQRPNNPPSSNFTLNQIPKNTGPISNESYFEPLKTSSEIQSPRQYQAYSPYQTFPPSNNPTNNSSVKTPLIYPDQKTFEEITSSKNRLINPTNIPFKNQSPPKNKDPRNSNPATQRNDSSNLNPRVIRVSRSPVLLKSDNDSNSRFTNNNWAKTLESSFDESKFSTGVFGTSNISQIKNSTFNPQNVKNTKPVTYNNVLPIRESITESTSPFGSKIAYYANKNTQLGNRIQKN